MIQLNQWKQQTKCSKFFGKISEKNEVVFRICQENSNSPDTAKSYSGYEDLLTPKLAGDFIAEYTSSGEQCEYFAICMHCKKWYDQLSHDSMFFHYFTSSKWFTNFNIIFLSYTTWQDVNKISWNDL